MGCHYSTATQDASPNPNPSLQRPYAYPIGSRTTVDEHHQTFPDAPSLKDFNVVYTDFIGERSGKISDYYNLISPPIGKGAYGEVRKAVHKRTNITRAVKVIYKSKTGKEAQERLINEVNILKRLDHPHIMKVYEFYQDEKCLYIVSEYYTGGELFDKISSMSSFTEKWAASTMKQILSAINYCHLNKIVHRDLKPENIIYESKQPGALLKIIDFGTSRLYDFKSQMHQRYGTPYYIAPEVLNQNYTEKCDIWSCGVILYILLCGFPPFNGETDKEIIGNVSRGKYSFDFPEWKSVSKQAKTLVSKMLEIDPKKRITAEKALTDPWFKLVLGETTFDKPLAVTTLTNLKHFRAERKLQYATWMFLVSYLASTEEQNQLLKTFEALDENGDGQLSREELIKGYRTFMHSDDPEAAVDAIMKEVDNNNSGYIDYTEFVIATVNRKNMLKKEKLEAAFKLFDKDGDGYLTADELEEVFNPGRQKDVSAQVWHDLIREFDQNGDGKISLNEFKEMMAQLI